MWTVVGNTDAATNEAIAIPFQLCWLIFCWPWWRHQMETFSALLALCAGNSPVTGEFPSQRPVTRSFDVFFDLHLNKRLSKQWWGWWFETPSRLLERHCNEETAHVLWLDSWNFYGSLPFCNIDGDCLDDDYNITVLAIRTICHDLNLGKATASWKQLRLLYQLNPWNLPGTALFSKYFPIFRH